MNYLISIMTDQPIIKSFLVNCIRDSSYRMKQSVFFLENRKVGSRGLISPYSDVIYCPSSINEYKRIVIIDTDSRSFNGIQKDKVKHIKEFIGHKYRDVNDTYFLYLSTPLKSEEFNIRSFIPKPLNRKTLTSIFDYVFDTNYLNDKIQA